MTEWPVPISGVLETVVTTPESSGSWAVAALGLHAGDPVTARTWGSTRTRNNFEARGEAYVQFTTDPVTFVEAALGRDVRSAPVLETADAWVRVTVESLETGSDRGTRWTDWALVPTATTVEARRVPVINRGFNAIVEATVAASRLDVSAFDDDRLRDELARHAAVVRRCGGDREHDALDRLIELSAWSP